jgi:hypothetical protein
MGRGRKMHYIFAIFLSLALWLSSGFGVIVGKLTMFEGLVGFALATLLMNTQDGRK